MSKNPALHSLKNAPILEFDPTPTAILEPHNPPLSCEPVDRAVLCFFFDVFASLVDQGRLEDVGALSSEIGRSPVYRLVHNGESLLVFHPGIGAPLAVGFLEELISLGVKRFIACGGCGVLDAAHEVGAVYIPTSAVRDEGTSYHYLAPSREVQPHPAAVNALKKACTLQAIPFRLVKTWTTDAIYRETRARRDLRLQEGCETVEMEAAAFFAVAKFRGVQFGQLLYGGDLVVPEGWDKRGWNERVSTRENLFWLAVDALLRMPPTNSTTE